MNTEELTHADTCEEELRAGMTIDRTRITGQPVAECAGCKFVSAYWECACDLEHNCEEYAY